MLLLQFIQYSLLSMRHTRCYTLCHTQCHTQCHTLCHTLCHTQCHKGFCWLQEELLRSDKELSKVKVRLNENSKQTLDMFLELFADFSRVSSAKAGRLSSKRDFFKSSPNLNTSSDSSSLSSSLSEHAAPSTLYGSDTPPPLTSHSTYSLHSQSMLDLSSPSHLNSSGLCQSMYELNSSPKGLGSSQFLEKVSGLRDRLSSLLETSYNKILSPPDLTSSYAKQVRLRKHKARPGGRVFSVFSRTNRRSVGFYEYTDRK